MHLILRKNTYTQNVHGASDILHCYLLVHTPDMYTLKRILTTHTDTNYSQKCYKSY